MVVRQDVQFVHLRPGMQRHQLVVGHVGCCCRKVADGFAFHALEVDVAALSLLFLPGHADERSLYVVVDDLGPAAGTLLHFLLVGRIT